MTKKRTKAVVAAVALAGIAVAAATFGAGPTRAASDYTLLGIYQPLANVAINCPGDYATEDDLEAWQGKKHAFVFYPMDFGKSEALDAAFQCMTVIWERGAVPNVHWRPDKDVAEGTAVLPPGLPIAINAGAYDAYIVEWATKMKTWLKGVDPTDPADDRRAFITLFPEINGNWHPWSPGYGPRPCENFKQDPGWQPGEPASCPAPLTPLEDVDTVRNPTTADTYKKMWRRVVELVRGEIGPGHPLTSTTSTTSASSTTATTAEPSAPVWAIRDRKRLVWGWMVYAYDAGGVSAESMYPGDDLVDWVGVDGYPYKPDMTPRDLLGRMVDRMQAMTSKPLYIDQVGVHVYPQQAASTTTTSLVGGPLPAIDESIQFTKNVASALTDPRWDAALKSEWIRLYWEFVHDEGIKLSQWFNVGEKRMFERAGVNPQAVGDCQYTSPTLVGYRGYCSYRDGVQSTWVRGGRGRANGVVTDDELLGQ